MISILSRKLKVRLGFVVATLIFQFVGSRVPVFNSSHLLQYEQPSNNLQLQKFGVELNNQSLASGISGPGSPAGSPIRENPTDPRTEPPSLIHSASIRWDALYYHDVALRGTYLFGQHYAFSPGVPLILRLVNLAKPLDGRSTDYASKRVRRTFFAWSSFKPLGMRACHGRRYFSAALHFALATSFRTNGILLSGFILYDLIARPVLAETISTISKATRTTSKPASKAFLRAARNIPPLDTVYSLFLTNMLESNRVTICAPSIFCPLWTKQPICWKIPLGEVSGTLAGGGLVQWGNLGSGGLVVVGWWPLEFL
ncbi:hypothetical protein BDV93DRAFT_569825 [Ceratobasidium sp. AG-I]|nr:hypothetical protein BDV93DRAFT_569825 [Ceratobasidium sp. AG-I]